MKLTNWKPAVSSPKLDLNSTLFEDFLAQWVLDNFPYEIEQLKKEAEEYDVEFDLRKTAPFSDILDEWNGSDEDTAARLIKYKDWSYCDAKYFEERALSFALDKYEVELRKAWIAEQGYTAPFPAGSRVRYKHYEGVITNDFKYHNQGKSLALTDEQAAENAESERNGGIGRNGGFICKWEDLTLITEE